MSRMVCLVVCTAHSHRFSDILQRVSPPHTCHIHNEALHVHIDEHQAVIFVYGCVLFWNVDEHVRDHYMEIAAQTAIQPVDKVVRDEFGYNYGEYTYLRQDEVIINAKHVGDVQLALSFGFAQSVMLDMFEQMLDAHMEAMAPIPQHMARTGNIQLSHTEIAKHIGELFITSNLLNLHSNMLDTPEFFWVHHELDSVYQMIFKHLDVAARINIINTRLRILHEFLELLCNERHNRHAARLEIIIVVLISIEIVVTLVEIFLAHPPA